ncbi:energy-coupling factor transporter transmembrane component T family protein [Dialister sp.]|uniref:energy-coupling factor transporter transmembrane component T family protein n=1 Tax=Dialister sp. TaxID=1955814 RepID=UPI002E81F401|nr:energy-coupling factor transporter transmembrane component T [Dialister sp.]MEE3451922.1 energy-coupling factor transporter transmembrane component T [Dialister sp.]
MSFRQTWEGGNGNSFISTLDGRTKLSILFLYAILMIVVDNARTLFVLFTLTLIFHFLGKTPLHRWKILSVFLLMGLWGSISSQALFFAQNPRTPLLMLISPDFPVLGTLTKGLYIYKEGIIYGAIQGMRTVSMISLGLLVCWTSDPRNLLKALREWHLSPQASFMLVTAIRFFPILAAEAGEVMTTLQLRSNSTGGRHQVIRHVPYMLKPLMARCLRRSQTLSLSVTSRGLFLAKEQKGDLWQWKEKYACLILFLFTLSVGLGKLLYGLSLKGIYIGAFRFVYDWAKLYL